MAQTLHLVNTLKKALKAHGLTYSAIAKKVDLSEASIKRMFSEKNFTLNRLEQLCQCMDMELSDLLRLMQEEQQHLSQLSEAQEKEIVNDLNLLLITVCVLNRWTLNDIIERYKITETEGIRYLAKLDKLKIIELLPKNRIKESDLLNKDLKITLKNKKIIIRENYSKYNNKTKKMKNMKNMKKAIEKIFIIQKNFLVILMNKIFAQNMNMK